MKGKRETYAKISENLNKLPPQERVAARKRLRDELNKRKDVLFKKLPPTTKMNLKDLNRAVVIARKLRWSQK